MALAKDLSKKKFHKWTVVERDTATKKRNAHWICKCECGKIASISGNHLRRGNSKSCRRCSESKHKGKLNSRIWNRLLWHAKDRELIVEVTKEYMYELLYKQDKRCALTGVEIDIANTIKGDMAGETTASPDRIDSLKGYVVGNVQWVHKSINRMKSDLQEDEFVKLCILVADHNRKEAI